MTINWQVRIGNPQFWKSFIPAVIVLIQVVSAVFGFEIDLGELGNRLLDVVNAVFVVLAIMGIVNDPTTAGTSDSVQALSYKRPKEDGANDA